MLWTVSEHIRAHILRRAFPPRHSLDELLQTQWSPQFITYMRNRLLMGAYRYGLLGRNQKPYDSVGSLVRRAQAYLRDGNQEHLVDIANLALVEFLKGDCHPSPHWTPTDDGVHTEELHHG